MTSETSRKAIGNYSESAGPLEDRLLRAADIADFLDVSKSRAHELMANGTLPAIRIGRSIRVSRRSLEQWIREQEAKSRQHVA